MITHSLADLQPDDPVIVLVNNVPFFGVVTKLRGLSADIAEVVWFGIQPDFHKEFEKVDLLTFDAADMVCKVKNSVHHDFKLSSGLGIKDRMLVMSHRIVHRSSDWDKLAENYRLKLAQEFRDTLDEYSKRAEFFRDTKFSDAENCYASLTKEQQENIRFYFTHVDPIYTPAMA